MSFPPATVSCMVISPSIPTEPSWSAGRTITVPPAAPGTAPLISSRLRSISTRTTSRFCVVTRSSPMCPDIFLPLNTRPGVWHWPIEPGARCDSELPWLASWVRKLCRFTTPAKPLPLLVPVTSTRSPASNMSTLSSAPVSRSSPSPCGKRSSHRPSPASTPALAKWPATGLFSRLPRRRPKVTWMER